jgi:hypothetical protein
MQPFRATERARQQPSVLILFRNLAVVGPVHSQAIGKGAGDASLERL